MTAAWANRKHLDGGGFAGAGEYDRSGSLDEVQAGGAREEFVKTPVIFGVQRVINIGAEIKQKFLLRQLQLAGGFRADLWKLS